MLFLLVGKFLYDKDFCSNIFGGFFIRLFINPKFSPSLVLGRFFVRNQKSEYVGTAQKKTAWGLGFLLALIMFTTIVVLNAFSPLNALVCISCLLLLFFESVFGICLGCKIYLTKKNPSFAPVELVKLWKKKKFKK